MNSFFLLASSLVLLGLQLPVQANAQSPETATAQTDAMKVRLTLRDGSTANATLLDNAKTRAFVALLPLRIPMADHFGRELYGPLPRSITSEGGLQTTYAAGDIAYWPPGPGFAIYYDVDGPAIPGDGIALLGALDSGIEIFAGGPNEVTVELLP